MACLKWEPVTLESILRPNSLLATHPMLTPEFVSKKSRKQDWDGAYDQFAVLYKERQELEPDEDWSFPPDLSKIHDAEFWGLPEGVH